MEVHIIIKSTSVDYHGRYDEIVNIYSDKNKAIKACDTLNEDKKYDIEFYIDSWIVK